MWVFLKGGRIRRLSRAVCVFCFGHSINSLWSPGFGLIRLIHIYKSSSLWTFVYHSLCNKVYICGIKANLTRDPIFRPVAGYVNLCPEDISTRSHQIEEMHSIIRHEMLHALVRLHFLIDSFCFYCYTCICNYMEMWWYYALYHIVILGTMSHDSALMHYVTW